MKIMQFADAVNKIKFSEAVIYSIGSNEDAITNLQAIQLQSGKKRDGQDLPLYSITSVTVYGKQPGPWTLKDTGAFYKAFVIKNIGKRGFVIISTDNKTNMLVNKVQKKQGFGGGIFGLNDATRKGGSKNPPLAEILIPKIQQEISRQSGIKFN